VVLRWARSLRVLLEMRASRRLLERCLEPPDLMMVSLRRVPMELPREVTRESSLAPPHLELPPEFVLVLSPKADRRIGYWFDSFLTRIFQPGFFDSDHRLFEAHRPEFL
jgi:hypothetical protein